MSQIVSANIMDELTKCDNCKRIYNYYDFQAHSENCFRMPPPDQEPEQTELISKAKFNINSYKNSVNILKPHLQRSLGASYNMFYNSSTMNINPYFNDNNVLNELMHTIPNNTIESTSEQLVEQLVDQLNDIEINSRGVSRIELNKYSQQIQIAIPFECSICLNTHNVGDEYLAIKCGHIFCLECSIKWFERKSLCPLCKCDIRF